MKILFLPVILAQTIPPEPCILPAPPIKLMVLPLAQAQLTAGDRISNTWISLASWEMNQILNALLEEPQPHHLHLQDVQDAVQQPVALMLASLVSSHSDLMEFSTMSAPLMAILQEKLYRGAPQ